MAKSRVFISSTFLDLRQVREYIERMIRELGHESVLLITVRADATDLILGAVARLISITWAPKPV